MTHPGLQVGEAGPACAAKVLPRVAQVVEVQTWPADASRGCGPAGVAADVTPPKQSAKRACEDQRHLVWARLGIEVLSQDGHDRLRNGDGAYARLRLRRANTAASAKPQARRQRRLPGLGE